ncbi:hypothetical protein FA09DRAFT_328369 [Tilletiopsis washingtonensis]|uniref:Structure-specific endonuclease subunit SLX4 n=1 Tax=Tilletiopsis washingtonensis TaxID=58919 RepID=A0A316ZJ25_9BASI|nr:hypothetical protein FA09DRAFT_328369 [Tilletiopsis washingtonensis]PWO00264.1 hypothetical protein FA09DRAFT_328369 [Tilletiopsis washingtonensis]
MSGLLAQLDALSAAAAAPAKAPKAKSAKSRASAEGAAVKVPKAAKAARVAKSKPKAKASAPEEQADEATLLALQAQVRAFGLRPAAGVAALRSQLAACQAALREREAEAAASASAAGDTSMHSTWSAPGDVDEPGDVTMQLAREADTDAEREPSSDEVPLAQSVRRRRRRRSASMDDDAAVDDDTSSGADEPAEAAPGAVERTLDEALQRAVRGDAQLRRRILQLEPVAFDEVLSVATRAGVRFKKKDSVRDWLDAGICFYSAELTGARSRH